MATPSTTPPRDAINPELDAAVALQSSTAPTLNEDSPVQVAPLRQAERRQAERVEADGPSVVEAAVEASFAAAEPADAKLKDGPRQQSLEGFAQAGAPTTGKPQSEVSDPEREVASVREIKERLAESRMAGSAMDAAEAASVVAADLRALRQLEGDRSREEAAQLIGEAAASDSNYRRALQQVAPDVAEASQKAWAEIAPSRVGPSLNEDVLSAETGIMVRYNEARWSASSFASLDSQAARAMASEDVRDLRTLSWERNFASVAEHVAQNMEHPAYKARLEEEDPALARVVIALRDSPREQDLRSGSSPEAAAQASSDPDASRFDADQLRRLEAVRQRDSQAAAASLGLGSGGAGEPPSIADLDARMASAQITERGWRDRADIADLMRDLEVAAQRDWQSVAKLWDKHRPGEIDKPAFIDGDDVAEPRADKSRPGGSASRVEAEAGLPRRDDEEPGAYDVPDSVRKRYLQTDGRFYLRDQASTLAFEDSGKKLATTLDDPEVAKSMVEVAEAKGWDSLRLRGTEDFRREAWLQASLRGLETEGYKPRDVDLARLNELKAERSEDLDGRINSIEQAPSRVLEQSKSAGLVVDEPVSALSDQQRQVVDLMRDVMRQRGDSDLAIRLASDAAADRVNSNRVYVGKVVEIGRAPYGFDDKNEDSDFVKLETSRGEKTVWGVDLPRALSAGNVSQGDEIALAYRGRRAVEVEVPVRDESGNAVGSRTVTTHRNTWEALRVDALRDEVRAELYKRAANADRAPLVPVYDRDADRSSPAADPSMDRARQADRVR